MRTYTAQVQQLRDEAFAVTELVLGLEKEYENTGVVDPKTMHQVATGIRVMQKTQERMARMSQLVHEVVPKATPVEARRRRTKPTVLVPARKMIYSDYQAERYETQEDTPCNMVRCVPCDMRINGGEVEVQLVKDGKFFPAIYSEEESTFRIIEPVTHTSPGKLMLNAVIEKANQQSEQNAQASERRKEAAASGYTKVYGPSKYPGMVTEDGFEKTGDDFQREYNREARGR